jgi:hypothetical protein
MPYKDELDDGMKIQVLSLNGHEWLDYHEKIIQAAWEAQHAISTSNYTSVLAIVKSNQWPSNLREKQCLT